MPQRPFGPTPRRSHSQCICAICAIRVRIFGRQCRAGASAPALGAMGLKHGVSAEPGDRIHCFAHWRTVGRSRGQTRLFYFSALDPTAPRSRGFGLCVPAGLCVFPLWSPPAPPARVPGSGAMVSHGEHGYHGFPTDAASPLWSYTAPERGRPVRPRYAKTPSGIRASSGEGSSISSTSSGRRYGARRPAEPGGASPPGEPPILHTKPHAKSAKVGRIQKSDALAIR